MNSVFAASGLAGFTNLNTTFGFGTRRVEDGAPDVRRNQLRSVPTGSAGLSGLQYSMACTRRSCPCAWASQC
jgi:hypothetical protein